MDLNATVTIDRLFEDVSEQFIDEILSGALGNHGAALAGDDQGRLIVIFDLEAPDWGSGAAIAASLCAGLGDLVSMLLQTGEEAEDQLA